PALAVPAPRPPTRPRRPLLLQALPPRRRVASQGGRSEEGRRSRDAGPHTRHRAVDRDVCEEEEMRARCGGLLAFVVILGTPSFHVVVVSPDLRGLMSALWVENNRHWDELAVQQTLTPFWGTGTP